jgi:signal transduction histidine kinase
MQKPAQHQATRQADRERRKAALNLMEDAKASYSASERYCSERHHAEQELRRVEEKYRSLTESIDAGFFIVEPIDPTDGEPREYRFVEANPSFAIQTGVHGVVGRSVREVFSGGTENWYSIFDSVLKTGESIRLERVLGAQSRVFELYAFRTRTSFSDGVAVISKDVSERKITERSLRNLDRRKSEYMAVLAHEIRNPLASISTGLQLLRFSGDHDSESTSVYKSMERQVRYMVRLVDDLMEISRLTTGKIELKKGLCELSTILRRAVEISRPLMKESKHAIQISLPEDSIPLYVDEVRLCQVFVNVLNNAAKYTNEAGKIWLRAGQVGTDAFVSIKDNGIGIPPAQLSAIFDMFTQVDGSHERRQGGLGIGLTLAKTIVELHEGTISAYSSGLSAGSEFVVRLPLQPEQRAELNGRPRSSIA